MRARTRPKPAPRDIPEEPADGEVEVRGKPTIDPYEDPTPVGADPEAVAEEKPEPQPASPPLARVPVDKRVQEALADLEASKERLTREAEREREQLRAQLVLELLPVLDNLDRSLEAAKDSPDQGLRDGVRMVRDQFDQVLRGFGVEVIEAEGVPFNPAEHEALTMVPVSDPDLHRTVVDVLRPGYRQNGRLLRAAQVSVGDHRPDASDEEHAVPVADA